MKIYLAGPMTGYPEFNHPAFHAAAARLRAAGHDVFSPAEHDNDLGIDVTGRTGNEALTDISAVSLRKVLGDDLAYITSTADGLALLDGWGVSKGARAEVCTAIAIRIPVAPVTAWLNGANLRHMTELISQVVYGGSSDFEQVHA